MSVNKSVVPALTIRLVARDERSNYLPSIYDVGTVMVNLQQLVNKIAYYRQHDSLPARPILSRNEADKVNLVIGKNGPGGSWGAEFLPDIMGHFDAALVADYIKDLLVILTAFSAGKLGSYLESRKTKTKQKSSSHDHDTEAPAALISGSFPHVRDITVRVSPRSLGDVVAVEVSSPLHPKDKPVILSISTHKYIRSIEKEYVKGARTVIRGRFTTLVTERGFAELRLSPRRVVRVQYGKLLPFVRRNTGTGKPIKVHGYPIYKIGTSTEVIKDFVATFIESDD